MPVCCRICGSENLRPSHLLVTDWRYFVKLRYPIRCRKCRKRGSVRLWKIFAVRNKANARRSSEESARPLRVVTFVDVPRTEDFE